MTIAEPEWTPDQRAWMLGLAVYRSGRCPGCSGPLAETTNAENENRYHTTAIRCFQCTSQTVSAKQFDVPTVTAPNAILYVSELR